MRTLLPVVLLLLSTSSAAQMFFGSPSHIATARHGANAFAEPSRQLRVTPGADSFLVTWMDDRAAAVHGSTWANAAMGVRVSLTGQPLGPRFELPFVPLDVVWNGHHWIAFSTEAFVRVTRDGVLLDREPRALERRFAYDARATWTGSVIVIATFTDSALVAVIVDEEMRPLREHVLYPLLVRPPHSGMIAGAVSDGATAMVLYRDPEVAAAEYYSAMLDRFGELIAHDPTGVSFSSIAVGAADEGYLLVVPEYETSNAHRVVAVGRDNRMRDRRVALGNERQRSLRVASSLVWDGAAFTLLHGHTTPFGYDPTGWSATRLGPTGKKEGASSALDSFFGMPVTAGLGRTMLVVTGTLGGRLWSRTAPDAASLAAAEQFELVLGPARQETPAAASSGDQSLVVWREKFTPGLLQLFGARVTDSGAVLDPHSIALSAATCPGEPPVVVSDGRDFLVAWAGPERAEVRKVYADGTVRRPEMLDAARGCYAVRRLAGASNGSGALFVWVEKEDRLQRVIGRLVDADGVPTGVRPIIIGTTADLDAFAHVASDGRDYLVAFGEEAVRVSAEGALLEKDRTFGDRARALGVFWNGESYVALAWSDGHRLFRVAADLSAPGRRDPLPPVLDLPFLGGYEFPGAFACHDGVCIAPFGERLLKVNAADLSVSLDAIDPAVEPRLSTVMTGARRPLLVYQGRPMETPYAGIPRVLVRAVVTPKPRAVRH